MVEQTEPTMEEIVVALRETRRGAGRTPPLTVVRGRGLDDRMPYATPTGENRDVGRGHVGAADPNNAATSTDITGIRDAEIERLLADNARCNERIMFLLKVIEYEQACKAAATADTFAVDRVTILRDVKSSLDAELRPVLLILHRLLEKQQQSRPAGGSALAPGPQAPCPGASPEPSGWITDMGRELDRRGEAMEWKMPPAEAGVMQLPSLRQRMSRAFDALWSWSGTEMPPLRQVRRQVSNDP